MDSNNISKNEKNIWGITINKADYVKIVSRRYTYKYKAVEDLVIETLKEAGRNFKFLTIVEILDEVNNKVKQKNILTGKPIDYRFVYRVLRKFRILANKRQSDSRGYPRGTIIEKDGMKQLAFEWVE